MISPEKYIIRNSEVIWRVLDDEIFVINPDGKNVHVLNKVASFIWELSEGNTKVSQIVNLVCDRFDISEDVALADTSELVEKMLAKSLIELSDTPQQQ